MSLLCLWSSHSFFRSFSFLINLLSLYFMDSLQILSFFLFFFFDAISRYQYIFLIYLAVCFLRQGLTLSPRLECSGAVTAQCPPRLKRFPHSAFRVAGTTGSCHHSQLNFKIFVDSGSQYIDQAGLKLLGSSNPPTLASQNAGMTGTGDTTSEFLEFISEIIS